MSTLSRNFSLTRAKKNENEMVNAKAKSSLPVQVKRNALKDLAPNAINRPTSVIDPKANRAKINPTNKATLSKVPVFRNNSFRPLKSVKENINPVVRSKEAITASQIEKQTEKLVAQLPNVHIEAIVQAEEVLIVDSSTKVSLVQEIPAHVHDIDQGNENDPHLVSVYTPEIFNYLRILENKWMLKENFLEGGEIMPKMRTVLVDWLVDVSQEYRLIHDTLHITIGIVDLYLQKVKTLKRDQLQLVGISAMFVACKYEEITMPDIEDFVYIAANVYTKKEIFRTERAIFEAIGFSISRPISLNFLRRYSKAGDATPKHHSFSKYFLDLALLDYSLCPVAPSLLAASALYLAFLCISTRKSLSGLEQNAFWTPTLQYYSGYSVQEVEKIAKKLAATVASYRDHSKIQAVQRKFSSTRFSKASLQPVMSDFVKQYAAAGKEAEKIAIEGTPA